MHWKSKAIHHHKVNGQYLYSPLAIWMNRYVFLRRSIISWAPSLFIMGLRFFFYTSLYIFNNNFLFIWWLFWGENDNVVLHRLPIMRCLYIYLLTIRRIHGHPIKCVTSDMNRHWQKCLCCIICDMRTNTCIHSESNEGYVNV